jgi:hypothetical protein
MHVMSIHKAYINYIKLKPLSRGFSIANMQVEKLVLAVNYKRI